MSGPSFTEANVVQNPLIRYAEEIGWVYLSPEQALTLRRGESGTLLYSLLRDKLIHLNPGVIDLANADAVIQRIESARNNIEGNAEVLAWLRGERTVYVESEQRHRNVTLLDFDHPAENTFHVTSEWSYTNDRHRNRADVVFLTNGVPVVVVETKSAAKRNGIEDALDQIRRYHAQTPELMTAPQVFNLTHLIDFHYGATWSLDRQGLYNWKDEELGNFERKVKRFFARERFLKLLQSWIVFFQKDEELRKIILRQHQTRAVEKVVGRALDPEKTRGLVWHTQGSGKTLTMMKAADLILNQPALAKPTVIMLVDRNELQAQLFGNLSAYGLSHEVATSKRRLRELLHSDYRGLIVSMVHKFDGADAGLSARRNVFVLIDEAHRTTSGDLGNYLVAALPNATLIGFTGTPIDRIAYGQGTFKVFGGDDEQGYLDKYTIAEAIEDGTTLPIRYTLAPSDIRVPGEILEREFLTLAEAQGVSDIEELNKILERAVTLKNFLKSRDRVARVSQHVADHFSQAVEPLGYKAFLVGVDREACALYKEALDRLLPSEYSQVVYTSQHNDPELLARYSLSDDQEKQIRRAFIKTDRMPKILIVTEKLLTGFDAPILYCMYLDKPMRDHTLLQAIARVNRPYEDAKGIRKPVGFVLDFVGIFERLKKALAFDSDVVGTAIENIDVLRARWRTLFEEQAPAYLAACRAPVIDDKAVEAAIAAFEDKERRDAFLRFFEELEDLYEILSPDAFLRPFMDDYARLAQLYQIVQNAFGKRVALVRDLMRKTETLVKEAVTASGIAPAMKPVSIDEETLRALKTGQPLDSPRVINLGRSLVAAASGDGGQPALLSIVERAERVLEDYDDRQMTTGTALVELERLVREYLDAKQQQEESGLPPQTFSLMWALSSDGIAAARRLALALEEAFERYPAFQDSASQARDLKAEIYKLLLQGGVADEKVVGIVATIMECRKREAPRRPS